MVSTLDTVILGFMIYCFGMYLLVNYIFCSEKNTKNIKFMTTMVFIFISGLPPTPLFFVKLWAISELSGFVWITTLLFMVCVNSALLYAYYDYLTKSVTAGEEVTPGDKKNKTSPWVEVLLLTSLMALTPLLFMLF